MDLLSLPNEILQHIFTVMDHQSRLTVRQVCRKWNALASTVPSMDQIWLRLTFKRIKFLLQKTTPGINFQKYRHLVIDCHDSTTPQMNQLRKLLTAVHNVQSLVLFGINDVAESELLACLQDVPNLKRLYLLGTDVSDFQQAYFSDMPKIATWNFSAHKHQRPHQWIDIFTKHSKLVLDKVTDVFLALPCRLNFSVKYFPQMFPNVNQLQVTVSNPSIVKIINAYKDQLKTLSVCSIDPEIFTPLYGISFSKLSRLYLKFELATLKWITNKRACKNFSRNCDLALKAICSNCSSLQILDVIVPNVSFLEDISKLEKLQKLYIRENGRLYLDNMRYEAEMTNKPKTLDDRLPVFYPSHRQPILSLKIVEINGSFCPVPYLLTKLDMLAPNLEVLTLNHIGGPEETLHVLSEKLPSIRHLKLSLREEPRKNFGCLKSKTNLETYSLTDVRIDRDNMENWIQMAPNLSKISLKPRSQLNEADLWTLAFCCRKLQQLELADCTDDVTTKGLQEFRQNVPHVRITCKKHTNCGSFP